MMRLDLQEASGLRARARLGTASGHMLEPVATGRGEAALTIFSDEDELGDAFQALSHALNAIFAEVRAKREATRLEFQGEHA